MVEFYYWREGSGGKSRLETVVLFLPDVWSAQPSRVDWTTVQEQYKAACEAAIKKLDGAPTSESSSNEQSQPPAATPAPATADADGEPTADKSQIVCSQFCLVKFPAACSAVLYRRHRRLCRCDDVRTPRCRSNIGSNWITNRFFFLCSIFHHK